MKLKFLVFFIFFALGSAFAQTGKTVGPLLQTNWTQRTPYNNLMVGNVRHRTGCGTTAMAQIMKYYGHPARGSGQSEPYSTGIGTTAPSVNFNVPYDWSNMLNSYNGDATQRQADAVATLMYHVAAGFRINSGRAGTDSGTSITRIIQAMTTHFGYDKSMLRRDRIYFDDAAWEKIIKDQLDAGMPVFYWFPGHYYVIDGYDGSGRFHFNWGWGRQNGWYPLTVDWRTLGSEDAEMNADDDGQSMIINIKPDARGVLPG
ncbi:MAG: C10 family peptidase, partial [Spirochaetaceae bacterium]|nr:C10 family peptidase [Spirochaetaceae bacterium]